MAVQLASSVDAKALSGPGLRAFFRIADLWKLSVAEQRALLGHPPKSTFFNWKKGVGTLSRDTLERISHVLGIYKSLQILLPRPDSADTWVKRPNNGAPFGGKPALERMLKGMGDLYTVRQYLDAQRGGWA